MSDSVVKIESLSKKFKFYEKPHHRIVEWVTNGKVTRHQELWALKDISFEVKKGECVGIIGHNGAGKSTLLKILSKALWPTSGSFEVQGNIVSLLELGTGFHPELSGIENIFNSGRILGFSDSFIKEKLDAIVGFADLKDFIHHPVKTYSSGMYVRLAFSLFANLEPDVYIVDEALSVGDIFFQQKCFAFLEKLKVQGTAIIIVSHDTQVILKYCDRALILEDGQISHMGNPLDMVNLYYASSSKKHVHSKSICSENKEQYREDELDLNKSFELKGSNNITNAAGMRRGNRKIEFIGARLCNLFGDEINTAKFGDIVELELYVKANADINDLALSFQMTDRLNNVIFGQSQYMLTKEKLKISKDECMNVIFRIKLNLFEGLYTIALGASECNLEFANEIYDWVEGCLLIEVIKPEWRLFHGISSLETSFKVVYSNKGITQNKI